MTSGLMVGPTATAGSGGSGGSGGSVLGLALSVHYYNNNNTFIDRRKPGWLISHTYIIPYISIECNLKDMNTNLVNAVNTCESRACIKFRNLSFTLRKTKLGLSQY